MTSVRMFEAVAFAAAFLATGCRCDLHGEDVTGAPRSDRACLRRADGSAGKWIAVGQYAQEARRC